MIAITGYCANESRQPAPTFRAVTDHQRAEQLTKVSGRDEYADLGSAEAPKRAENRQHLRNCQGIERVKEGRGADQDARLEMPWRKRQSFDTCGDGADRRSLPVVTWFDADRCGANRCGHLTLPVSMRLPPLRDCSASCGCWTLCGDLTPGLHTFLPVRNGSSGVLSPQNGARASVTP